MPIVAARIIYGGAAVLLVVALLGMRSASHSVARYPVVLPGGVPAVVFEPGLQRRAEVGDPEVRLPIVVLAHGFARNRGAMTSLARRLTRAGYAVVCFDFRGHGQNPEPFDTTDGFPREGLLDDVDAAVLWSRMQDGWDGQRLALIGHAMGAAVVMEYAARRDPAVGAVVAISGSSPYVSPYKPPNVLLLWAERDSSRMRDRARDVGATLIGRSLIVLDRGYGEPERGTAVRATEVPGAYHTNVVYLDETARRIADWLALTIGDGTETRSGEGDARLPWAALGLAAALVLLWGLPAVLAPLGRVVTLEQPDTPVRRALWLVLALAVGGVVLAGFDRLAGSSALEAVPLLVARDACALLLIAGLVLAVWGARTGGVRADGLADRRTLVVAGLMLAFIYLAGALLLAPFVDAVPSSWRLLPWLGCTLAALPFFGATEWLLRGPGAGLWLAPAGKALTLGALALAALAGVPLLPALVPLAVLFALFELTGLRLARVAPNPWQSALVQAGWLGWYLATLFPLAR